MKITLRTLSDSDNSHKSLIDFENNGEDAIQITTHDGPGDREIEVSAAELESALNALKGGR